MKYGCCGSMVATEPDGTGVEIIEKLGAIGYDYMEISLAHITALSETDFMSMKKRVRDAGISCETCNNFFPSSIHLTGPREDENKTMDYSRKALERASQLGVEIIVFGSASAKNIPDGFPYEQAWNQIAKMLKTIAPIARERGITIAIEPLNKIESNLINTISEGLQMVKSVDMDNIRLLADYYHMTVSNETYDIILESGQAIKHVHFAEVLGRRFPGTLKEEYLEFFGNLKNAGYKGRVSIEAYSDDVLNDAAIALEILKDIDEQLQG
ncbi:MAG: sugar phosphate isomerase/epimerase [Sedimentisphaerales bacterium]